MYDAVIDEIDGRRIRIGDTGWSDCASCNYLGFDLDPEIMDAIDRAGAPLGHPPELVAAAGQPALYPQIEERLTDLLGAPDTLVLPTITQIHMSVIPILAGAGHDLLDAQAHKTIYDGCVYARGLGATVHRLPHRRPRRSSRSCCARPGRAAAGLHGRRQQHDRQRRRTWPRFARCAASTTRCSTSTTPTASA